MKALLDKVVSLDKVLGERATVGLDIGADSVKTVQISRVSKKISLLKAGCKEINVPSEFADGFDQASVAQAVRDLWRELKIRTKTVNLVISDMAVYSRHIRVPNVAEEELIKAIKWQAEKYVPFAIEDAIVDFQTLGTPVKENNEIEIVLVAVEKDLVKRYLSVLEDIKIKPVVLDYSPFAVAKAVVQNYTVSSEEILPVIDIGATTSSIVIIKGMEMVLARSIGLGSRALTMAVKDGLNVGQEEAERIKREFDIYSRDTGNEDKQSVILACMDAVLSDFVAQVNRSFAYCEGEYPLESMQKLILTGGGASLKGLDKYLESKLSLPVEILNPFENIAVDKVKHTAQPWSELPAKLAGAWGTIL